MAERNFLDLLLAHCCAALSSWTGSLFPSSSLWEARLTTSELQLLTGQHAVINILSSLSAKKQTYMKIWWPVTDISVGCLSVFCQWLFLFGYKRRAQAMKLRDQVFLERESTSLISSHLLLCVSSWKGLMKEIRVCLTAVCLSAVQHRVFVWRRATAEWSWRMDWG